MDSGSRFFRRITAVLLTVFLLMAHVSYVFAEGSASGNDLLTVEETENSVDAVRALASDLHSNNPTLGRNGGFTWDTEGKNRSWTYYNGIMMDAFLMLDLEEYKNYVDSFYNANVASSGKVDNTGSSGNRYNEKELDSIPPTRALFDLIREDSAQSVKYKKMIDYVYSVMLGFKVVDGTDGNFIHKIDNENWKKYQVALDGLYMAQPFFMEIANALEDHTLTNNDFQTYSKTTLNADTLYNAVYSRMKWIGDNLYDENKKLYNHGWGPGVGVNGQFWLRAIGWYAAALADVIDMFPDRYAGKRTELINIAKKLFDGMMDYQNKETGLWYNVVDHDASLTNSNGNQNLPETSGSALMAYAMMKLYDKGYVEDSYGEAGLLAFNGIVSNHVDNQGLHNVYISSGVSANAVDYLSKDYVTNEAKGVGPLMMAASYAEAVANKLNTKTDPKATPPVANNLVYNGADQALVIPGTTEDGTFLYALVRKNRIAGPAAEDYSETVPAAKDAGTYEVWYYVRGDDRHNDTEPASIEVTIAKKPVTVSGIKANDKVYDGTADAVIDVSEAAFNGIEDGDKLSISAQGSFADANAEPDKTVQISALELSGDSVANYELASAGQQTSATASITQKAVIIKAHDQTVDLHGSISTKLKNVMVSEPSGEDDGNQISTEQGEVLMINGFPNHTLVSVTLQSSDTNSSKTDGTITPSNAVLKCGDADVTSNFNITYRNGVLTVQKGNVNIITEPQAAAITYGQKLEDSVLSGGLANDGTADIPGTFSWKEKDTAPSVSDSNKTTYDVIFTPNDENNYNPVILQVTLEVKKADQTAPAAPELQAASLTKISLKPIDGYEYSMDGEHWQTSNVFTGLTANTEYTFYQRRAGDENHNASPSSPAAQFRTGAHVHAWTYQADGPVLTETCSNTDGGHEGQTKSSLTLAAPAHKVYGDGLEAAASITGSIEGVQTLEVVYIRGSEELQSPPTDPGTYTASITAGGATASVSYTIAPKAVTVTAKDQTIREGESITTGPGQAVLEGALSGHSLSQVSFTVDEAHKKIIPSDAVISDGSRKDLTGNYSITYIPGTLTVKSQISRTVRFMVKNGYWDDGSDEVVEVVLSGYEGDELKLTAEQIPTVGTKPAEGFQAGSWDREPDTQTVIKENTKYIYSYVSSQGGDTPDQPSGDLQADESISVSGLSSGDKVSFYQVLKFDSSAAASGGWVNSTGFTLTEEEIQKILGLGDYAPGKEKAGQAGIDEAIAAKIADMAEAATAKYPNIPEAGGVAKQASPEAGLYVALITPKNPGDIYNPVFVGADYQNNSSHTWAVTMTDSYQPASMAKKGNVTLEKTATTMEANHEDKNAGTVAIGDTVSFTVKTKIPEYGNNYTKAVFKISDTLSKGLSLKVDTLKVYAAADAEDESKRITAGSGSYTLAATAGDKDTPGSYTINFATAYLLGLDAAQDIFITYDATVTSEADTSVNVLDNTVVVNFSNYPTDDSGKGTLKDETKHYTFDIDGNLLGEERYKATEVVKVALDADGNEITETRDLSNGKKVGALQGAEFRLYTAAGCEDADEYKGNAIFKNGAVIISDADGRLTVQGQTKPGIRGLDAGTYYLKETKAPAGYIKAQDPVKIEIIPEYKMTTKTETVDGIEVTWDYQELKSYEIKIAGTQTASYTMTNEKPDQGDTVVGTDGTSGKIQNTQGTELPSTGGPGTYFFYLLGIMLTGLAGAGIVMKGRRKEEV